MYPIIICEDDSTQLAGLKKLISNYLLFHEKIFKIELAATTPEEVITYLDTAKSKNGIYFLDIDLKADIDGIRLAQIIRQHDVQAKIIFVTTHDELAPLTLKKKVAAIDFIEKDQSLDDFRQEIFDALSYSKQLTDETLTVQKQNFSFTVGSQVYNLDKSEVVLIKTSDVPHHLEAYTVNGVYDFYGKLSEIEEKHDFFFKISRSCLINPQNIHQVDFSTREIEFINGTKQKFSIGKSRKLRALLQKIL
jgi:two-component system response regulator AgrA